MFDLNGDGHIVREELEEVFAGQSNFRGNWIKIWNTICAEADTDGDGELDKAEFEIAMHKFITK